MIIAFWAAVGKVALKVLSFLVGDKQGRKFLGYVIGIALFIVLLPVIAVYGLFGWMAGGGASDIVNYDEVYQNLPTEIREPLDENEVKLNMIETVFAENGIGSEDISKAKLQKDFPNSLHSEEYLAYLSSPTRENASEYITRTLEDNLPHIVDSPTYADYIATQPRAERLGSHGLFSSGDEPVVLSKVSKELNEHDDRCGGCRQDGILVILKY